MGRESPRPKAAPGPGPLHRRALAWMVHFYTFLGIPINIYCLRVVMIDRDPATFLLLNWLAIFVDATDGTLARLVDVKRNAPSFDGAMLDNLTDFLTFSVLPALAIRDCGLVPEGTGTPLAFLVLLASAYQFCQVSAKTTESFVGFPSYWNLVFQYVFIFQSPLWVAVTLYVSMAVLSFVPIHFVYPTRTRFARSLTLGLAGVWGIALCLPLAAPHSPAAFTAAKWSLLFVGYYTALSLYLHVRSGGTY